MKSLMNLLFGVIEIMAQLLRIIFFKYLMIVSKKVDIVVLKITVILQDKIMITKFLEVNQDLVLKN